MELPAPRGLQPPPLRSGVAGVNDLIQEVDLGRRLALQEQHVWLNMRMFRRAALGRRALPLQLILRGASGGGCSAGAGAATLVAASRRRLLHASSTVLRSREDAGEAIQDLGRARHADLAEALADLDELVGGSSSIRSNDNLGGGLAERSARQSAVDEHSGGQELTDLLAMVKQRDQPEEAATGGVAEDEEWGAAGAADLSDSSRDALNTVVRSRARAELTEALRQEEIADARARYNKKRWARNWVVKRTAELHRRKADAAEVEEAIQQMITRGDLPTVVTYNTLIAACGRPAGGRGRGGSAAVRPSDAKRAYNGYVEMKRRGLVPTASTYSALLTTLSRTASGGGPRAGASGRRGSSAAAARIEAAASGECSHLSVACPRVHP